MADRSNIADTNRAADQLREHAGRIGKDLREMATTAGDAAREKLQNVRERAGDLYDRGMDQASSMEEALEDYIRERPIRAALIAAGVGVLFGMMLRGGRR